MKEALFRRLNTDIPMLEQRALLSAMIELGREPAVDNDVRLKIGESGQVINFECGEHQYFKKLRGTMRPATETTEDGVHVISIEGALARKPDPFEMIYLGPMEASELVLEAIDAAQRAPNVRGVLLDVDSPGGFLLGGPEVAEAVRSLSAAKPTVAWTGGMMASLAYWIGSQAQYVFASPSAVVGSIGVYSTHLDFSKAFERLGVNVEVIRNKEGTYKAAGVYGTALTDEQRANFQAQVDSAFSSFKSAVTGTRKIGDEAMRGQTFDGNSAREANLVDGVTGRAGAMAVLRKLIEK